MSAGRPVIFRAQQTSKVRRRAEQGEELTGHQVNLDTLRLVLGVE